MTGIEEGFTIAYTNNMNKNQGNINIHLGHCKKTIRWPYKGFVKGNSLGWEPITEYKIIELLKSNDYTIEEFVKEFNQYLK